jgi:hypothetical protein
MEEKLLEHYSGKGTTFPQTLMFDHVSPATRLLEKRRQMFEVQEALNSQKEEFGRREDAFRRWEESLRRKDLELQESLIKFNKFLQENESKRNRALKRAAEERKQREQKETEIRKLESELKERLVEESLLKVEVEKTLKYQEFMENVVQNMTKFFPEVKDILNRFKTLSETNIDLSKKAQMSEEVAEDTRRDFTGYKKEKENDILNMNNAIAEKQVLMEHKVAGTAVLVLEMDKDIHEAAKKSLGVGQVLSSVENILGRCEHSFRVRHNKPMALVHENWSLLTLHDQCIKTMTKLDDIAMFMSDYQDICSSYISETEGGRRGGNLSSSASGMFDGSRSEVH